VILDTDLGSGVDGAFALALILGSPELELRGVTTVGADTNVKALMACRFLTATGRRHTPVSAGGDPQPARDVGGQYQYYYHPDVLFYRTSRPVKEKAVEFLAARLKAEPGKITILAAGPLTNVARLLSEHPESKRWVRRIVLVFDDNLRADVKAARTVFASGVPLVVVTQSAAGGLPLDESDLKRMFAPHTALSHQVQTMHQLWDRPAPLLASPLAAALCLDERFCQLSDLCLEIDDKGLMRRGKDAPNARVTVSTDRAKFMKWYVERMASLMKPVDAPAKLVPQGKLPRRVHVAEDFDTDIERRWWMSGKAETKNVPPGSTRACRGVLTHDFDDLLGDPRAMYTAVVFNPVPGPPMGPNTRLSFRYWLKGTGSLRVQIYSLTNGYHRHLVLTGLPQERWEAATVDMTQCRRPDGTGGPLAEDERIDDIQFYADPSAELIVDDIVLYDAGPPEETRPFPKRILFTGLFDTGKQGKEWPGDFEIVLHKAPLTWKAARSVLNSETDSPWIRLHLRGERPVGEATHLRFRYHLTGADAMRVGLVNRTTKETHIVERKGLSKEKWTEALVDFGAARRGGPRKGEHVDEVHFLLPRGAELLIDDVLLYEPGIVPKQ